MTYCKDCRTEFMVEADDPCPRCGRYLGGERMGQRAEVELPEQAEQPAAQQAPVSPPAAPAPEDASPRPAQQGQTLWDAIAQGFVSLFVRLVLIMLLAGMLLEKVLPPPVLKQCVVMMAITMAVITILSKTSQRAAQERARATAQQPPAPTVEPPRPAQQGQTPLDAAEDEDVPPSRMRRAMLALRALLAWLVAEASPNAPPLLMTRGMLLVLLTIPAGIGFGLLVFYQYQGRHPAAPLLWFLYLSVFVPPFVCLLTPDDALSALLRGHPWFWKLWLLWAVLAVGLFLWAMIDPNTFRIFLSVFGGGYY